MYIDSIQRKFFKYLYFKTNNLYLHFPYNISLALFNIILYFYSYFTFLYYVFAWRFYEYFFINIQFITIKFYLWYFQCIFKTVLSKSLLNILSLVHNFYIRLFYENNIMVSFSLYFFYSYSFIPKNTWIRKSIRCGVVRLKFSPSTVSLHSFNWFF